jgi:hypothetical protein
MIKVYNIGLLSGIEFFAIGKDRCLLDIAVIKDRTGLGMGFAFGPDDFFCAFLNLFRATLHLSLYSVRAIKDHNDWLDAC